MLPKDGNDTSVECVNALVVVLQKQMDDETGKKNHIKRTDTLQSDQRNVITSL